MTTLEKDTPSASAAKAGQGETKQAAVTSAQAGSTARPVAETIKPSVAAPQAQKIGVPDAQIRDMGLEPATPSQTRKLFNL